jgi:hypothetical protein
MKRRIAYFIGLIFLVMVFSGTVFAEEEASSIMCDNGVVNIGDMNVDVQDKCGQPSNQTMNEWEYNFGPAQPVYTVIFKEGQVVKILEDESGS